jgi:hypothetical protein
LQHRLSIPNFGEGTARAILAKVEILTDDRRYDQRGGEERKE